MMLPYQLCLAVQLCEGPVAPRLMVGADGPWVPFLPHSVLVALASQPLGGEGGRKAIQDIPYPPQLLPPLLQDLFLGWWLSPATS